MKKQFYIFLDIDGVLWSAPYIIREIDRGNIKRGLIKDLEPKCVDALNYFIKCLDKVYDVRLVISSSWRYHMESTIKTLKKYGLEYSKEIDRTIISKDTSKRGLEIKEYLSNKDNYEFVIIDDEMFDYNKEFNIDNIIKTDLYKDALTLELVKNHLNKIKLNINKR